MIRIEVDIEEKAPGQIGVSCRCLEGCWSDATDSERRCADGLVQEINQATKIVACRMGGKAREAAI